MKILVTGGLGYIGSHTVVELQNKGYNVVIIDNLSNTRLSVLEGIEAITNKKPKFHNIDLSDREAVNQFFKANQDLDGIIHFAAYKAVGESVKNPLMYYENNLFSLVNILQNIKAYNLSNFIFSSSCTVYGESKQQPITEFAPVLKAESPYGNTKQIGEEIIEDVYKSSNQFKAISLRYFNPIGAHNSAKIGELPLGVPQNLVPYITQTAAGIREQLQVFGDTYLTPDGTCIRDYIHVVDLALAHVKALEVLSKKDAATFYDTVNLGTGIGSSVLEVVKTFESVSGQTLNYKIVPKREGDITTAFADTTKAKQVLGWETKFTLAEALLSSWNWQNNL
jgi:UDP-glucose 4-epimerase